MKPANWFYARSGSKLFALLAFAISAQAQPIAPSGRQVQVPAGSSPVASPNRTNSSQLVTRRPINFMPPGKANDAVALVDANGKTLGRSFAASLYGDPGVVTTVNGRVTLLQGVTAPLTCDSNGNNCNYEKGLVWNASNGTLYYESADCSGTPFVFFTPVAAGFEQMGVAVREQEGHYMYLSEPSPQLITVRSIRSGFTEPYGQCYAANPYSLNVVRVLEVYPISLFGSPPFKWQ